MRMGTIFGLVATTALAACNGVSDNTPGEPGAQSADGEAMEFAVDGFTQVSLRGPDNVEVSVGEAFSVRAEGDPEALEDLKINVRGNALRVGRENDSYLGLGSNGEVTVYVTMPSIEGASVAGSGDMTIDTVEADEFDGAIAGSGNLDIAAITVTTAEFDVAGSGNISAAGNADQIEVGIAGSGNVDIDGLEARTLDVRIAGSGDVSATVTETVDASLVGSGDVAVDGGADCNSSTFGSGELVCR